MRGAGAAWGLVAMAVIAPASGGQEVAFTTASGAWNADDLGNHRAVVVVERAATAVRVVIPWRRRDPHPEERLVIVTDAAGAAVRNLRRGTIGRDAGELWFEPASGPGRYYVYYLPYRTSGRVNYPTVTYPPPAASADDAWLARLDRGSEVVAGTVERIESIDDFNSFHPMEVIATAEETEAMARRNAGAAFLVFPVDRMHPIRMRGDLPRSWIGSGAPGSFAATARRGEYLAFQLGVWALEDLADVRARSGGLAAGSGGRIPPSAFNCINTQGIDWTGRPMKLTVDVPRRTIQPLWCGIDVPRDAAPGTYRGIIRVGARGAPEAAVEIALTVVDTLAADGGAGEPWKQTRLKWLDSTLAQENEVIAPYTPLEAGGSTIRWLGRALELGPLGLPSRIETFFTPEMTSIGRAPTPVLAAPVELVVETVAGRVRFESGGPSFTRTGPGTAAWKAVGRSPALELSVEGELEFDGFARYSLALLALQDVDLTDVWLELPYARNAATYMMGLGVKGGRRPARLDWRWDVARKNQDSAWIGAVNAGLYFSLRGDNYARPLNTNFYLQKPLNLPPSWGNAGRGGIAVVEEGDAVAVRAFSGPRAMKAGETQRFDFCLIVTPFHPLDTDSQWRTRFYHRYAPVDEIKAAGATLVNIHHATPINPWINYPFLAADAMKAYVDEAHRKGLEVKIYDTVRELSNRACELFALRSLGHEIFSPGPGGGSSWLQEHLGGDYIAAWFVPELKDAAVVNSGMSRWHNYYVEGLNWLVRNIGIDGLYLDDVAFDRTTMKRVKRVLRGDGRPGLIDLHSANQFNERDGFVNSAVLYLEHFPYLDRLWFGEYFDYEGNSPEFFLTEVSGIPFGLMGEMLEKGGNPWRGMLFGMTNRLPWSESADPRPIWKAWDEFGMQGTRMIGWWVEGSPVRTDRADVPATVYAKEGSALVALASWADADIEVKLSVDWRALGIDPARAEIVAPRVDGFQEERRFAATEAIPVRRGRGWMLILAGGPLRGSGAAAAAASLPLPR